MMRAAASASRWVDASRQIDLARQAEQLKRHEHLTGKIAEALERRAGPKDREQFKVKVHHP